MSGERVLFLGDIVGEPGRAAVTATLPSLIERHEPDFVIATFDNMRRTIISMCLSLMITP